MCILSTCSRCQKLLTSQKLLTKAKYVKFLGLLLDENLRWKFHSFELSKKLARTCGIFFKIRCLLSTSKLILLYDTLFSPSLQYGIIVWGQTFASYLEPLVLIQNKVVRAIAHQHPFSILCESSRASKFSSPMIFFKLNYYALYMNQSI